MNDPFQEKDIDSLKRTHGVKIKSASRVRQEKERADEEAHRERFDRLADQAVNQRQQNDVDALAIINEFARIISDRTLSQNKGVVDTQQEETVRRQLIDIAIKINNDETQENLDMGSITLLNLLTKIIISYRNRMNELEYKLNQLYREKKDEQ